MIPKPTKDPISLLNTLSKLCKRVVQSRINNWINEINISTLIGFNKSFKKGLKTAAIFIDIEKAFDNVWHMGLLNYSSPIT